MKLFKYITGIILISLLLTAIVTYIINMGLKKSPTDFFGKINIINNPEQQIEILLAGSSRILTGVDPAVIDSFTGMRSYNAGLNAATIKTSYNIIRTALEKQINLKLVVLNIDYNMFDPKEDPYKDPYYYPYTDMSPVLYLNDKGIAAKLHKVRILDITSYDDYVMNAAAKGLFHSNNNLIKGFAPHVEPGYTPPDQSIVRKQEQPFTNEGINLLRTITATCKKQKVAIIFIIAPYVQGHSPAGYVTNYNTIIDDIKTVASELQVNVFDYSNDPISTDTGYFYNSWHLNAKGARVYSQKVALQLKNVLNNYSPGTSAIK
ncbi:hypothetical protein BH09BAC2_BH09BAC2_03220 [soil metagenome]